MSGHEHHLRALGRPVPEPITACPLQQPQQPPLRRPGEVHPADISQLSEQAGSLLANARRLIVEERPPQLVPVIHWPYVGHPGGAHH
jgi:hypothetical protein